MRTTWVIAGVIGLAVPIGCGGGGADTPTDGGLVGAIPEVHVYDAWVRPTGGDAAEVSMRVHNGGPEDDRLLKAECACDATVAIDGVLVVSPDQEVVLTPGATPGLRLTDLREDLPRGGFVTIVLTFEHAGDVTAELEVRRASS